MEMMTKVRTLGWLAAGAGAAWAAGAVGWSRRTRALQARLARLPARPGPTTSTSEKIASLPAPVRRYFDTALRDGAPLIAQARFVHEGTFNMGEETANWRRFSSTQVVNVRPPGFVWDARVRLAPGLRVHVHDAYVEGEGLLEARVLGLIKVAEQRGTPDLAAGELLRYLAEAAWYPTALLPDEGVTWTPLDDRSARATLTHGRTTVSLDFTFGSDGLIASIQTASRPRTLRSGVVNAGWQVRLWDDDERDGMRIPLEGEVAWMTPGGPYPYWRGRLVSMKYDYAR